jgi:glycosyltransferase involved in cell wall biosynthesis
MSTPLVTVICLSYNHERFVEEAIDSVSAQTYPNIQIIAVDDASKDNTASIVRNLTTKNPGIHFLPLSENVGNCKAFNRGLVFAKGKYIIDFSTDDVMLPDRIATQVAFFETLDKSFGVVFTDAVYISTEGQPLRQHYEYLLSKNIISSVPHGDVYRQVLSSFFIAPPTMMVRSDVFDYLKGYDEELAYEDFDFWVRSARTYKYAYLNKVTTKIRVVSTSMSKRQYKKGDKQVYSTYLVCKKAAALNESPEDDKALAKRLRYEVRQCVLTENHVEAQLFYELLVELGYKDFISNVFILLNRLRLPLLPVRKLYHRLRFGE